MKALRIHVRGVVQGVGFRPFIYKLASELSLAGWVLNASDGVHICVEGPDALVDEFPQLLQAGAPPAAAIEDLTAQSVVVSHFEGFEIRASVVDAHARTFISPDLATCPACAGELFKPENRRYRYPFINCTDCGPRFTLIEDTPYDRPLTTMRDFEMCEECAAEYADPSNRRFHAQPDACFVCGPRLYFNVVGATAVGEHNDWMWMPDVEIVPRPQRDREQELARSNSIIIEAAEALTQGQIVAIKGLGGFQLACNARSEIAVRRLRERKHRWGKPLAVMFANLEQAARYVELGEDERALLEGSIRPIVLCQRREIADGGAELALSIAPGIRELGVMLPYTPLHHLLLDEFYGPLVMTSGNKSGAPILTDNAAALEALGSATEGIADAFLLHDRPICGRYDDSVVRVIDRRVQLVRRARGYAPQPVTLPALEGNPATGDRHMPSILAVGPEQKNTFALVDGSRTESGIDSVDAFVSQHIGDLENTETLAAFEETECSFEHLFKITPETLAYDLHPEYLSTKWAKVQEAETATTSHPLRLVGVQHHHAHVVAAAAEHGVTEQVIGVAFDGTGYGVDGTIWGGEVLIASAALPAFERFAHLRCFSLPGGAGAVKRPLRVMYALLGAYGLTEHPGAATLVRRLEKHEGATIQAMVDKGLNTPQTSSMGRLFDAVASLLGVADDAVFEGAPAMMLEAVSSELESKPTPPRYRFGLLTTTSGEVIDPEPVIRALLDDLVAREEADSELTVAELSRRFHASVVTMIGDICTKTARATGLSTVVLSGGVFMNRLILSGARRILEDKGLTVLTNEQLPVNDGCVAYGQAAVARATLALEGAANQ